MTDTNPPSTRKIQMLINCAENFCLSADELEAIRESDRTTIVSERWSTSANPEGLLVFVRDGSVVSVISAEQTIAKGIV